MTDLSKLSYPLCAFTDATTVQQSRLRTQNGESSFAWFHATATFINSIPKTQLKVGLKLNDTDPLFVCINSLVLRGDMNDTLDFWRAAYHRVVALMLMDNRAARSLETIVQVNILAAAYLVSMGRR